MVDHAFKEYNIGIPYPQRDIHLRLPDERELAAVDSYERHPQKTSLQELQQQSQQGVTEENEP
jgi:small-conductance mechanosensitive channel